MKTITTVDELEALPEGAVIAFEDVGIPNAAVLASTEDGPRWWTTVDAPSANGDGYPHESIWSCYGESGEPGITLVYPLVFTAEDAERAIGEAEGALQNEYGGYQYPAAKAVARAVLGAVGEVEA